MKVINPKFHGYLDFVVVAVFLTAPTLLKFSNIPGFISYTLAGVHLALTLMTNFPMGMVKVIPFKIHGLIEMIVGPCLVVLPFVLGFTTDPNALYFYIINGIIILLVWALTDYRVR
jgi:hypothetical protein